MKNNPQVQVILASASPRRHELLRSAGIDFTVVVPQVVEQRQPGEPPETYAARNAAIKCAWVAGNLPAGMLNRPALVIAADTIVVLGGDVLEKPENERHACDMLRRLSDQIHQVMTGFTVRSVNVPRPQEMTRVIKTYVTFKSLSDWEIKRYVATGEPMDKAGAYGAQGGAGYLIRRIEGSYTNVVGLPVAELLDELNATFSEEWLG
jgi:septum formation protein